MLVYEYSEPYDTYNDSIAFGILTRRSKATLVRVLSDNSDDFIHISIEVSPCTCIGPMDIYIYFNWRDIVGW